MLALSLPGGTMFLAVMAMTVDGMRPGAIFEWRSGDFGDFITLNLIAAVGGFVIGIVALLLCFFLLLRKPLWIAWPLVFVPSFIAVQENVLWPSNVFGFNPIAWAITALVSIVVMSFVACFVLPDDLKLSRPGLCPKCGYDLRGDRDAGCSECGWGRWDQVVDG